MDSLDDSVLVGVAWRGRVLLSRRFHRHDDPKGPRVNLPFLRIDLRAWVDVFAGEIETVGQVAVRPLVGRWRALLDSERRVRIRFDPAVGEIGGRLEVEEPVVDAYGGSQLCTPAILRMHVDPEERAISDAGRLVKDTLFPDHPPFVFNTIACVGAADAEARGAYGDPTSVWFNVFFGCYQIDATKSDWNRPFGYRSADGSDSDIEFDDIIRLGKADWNFFSNWMYGVPRSAVDRHNAIEATPGEQQTTRIGDTLWHGASLGDVVCVSTYESDADGAERLVENSKIDDIWQRAFGLPNPQPGMAQSFVPTTLYAELYMAYQEDDVAYHTVICGGTANVGADERFIGAQMAAIRTVIENAYPTCGFPAG